MVNFSCLCSSFVHHDSFFVSSSFVRDFVVIVHPDTIRCLRHHSLFVFSPMSRVLTHVTCPHPCHVSLLCRWHAFEYGLCSVSCGGGVRIRTVQCVQGVLGSDKFAILPDAICPPPAPTNRKPCGMVDCSPEWHPDEWSEVRHAWLIITQRFPAIRDII